jgi:hypothetical protein
LLILLHSFVLELSEITSVLENLNEGFFFDGLSGSLLDGANGSASFFNKFFFGKSFSVNVGEINLVVISGGLTLNNGLVLDGNSFSKFCLVDADALV